MQWVHQHSKLLTPPLQQVDDANAAALAAECAARRLQQVTQRTRATGLREVRGNGSGYSGPIIHNSNAKATLICAMTHHVRIPTLL
jgi:hypothetical protein